MKEKEIIGNETKGKEMEMKEKEKKWKEMISISHKEILGILDILNTLPTRYERGCDCTKPTGNL